ENAQRDINIAFMNEITQIFSKLGISIWDVLDAAGTKWNFLPFQPGLVGGHCIGVDPYYLSHRAQQLGQEPHVILAGRSINDGMVLVAVPHSAYADMGDSELASLVNRGGLFADLKNVFRDRQLPDSVRYWTL